MTWIGDALAAGDRRTAREGPRGEEPGPRPAPAGADPREVEVLQELVTGNTNQGIGRRLGMAPKTVMHHASAIYRKLGVRGLAEAIALAVRQRMAD